MSTTGINYYDWVDFFRALSKEIHKIAKDKAKRDEALLQKAETTFGKDHSIFKYGKIDPFSFIYALAQRNTKNQRTGYFENAKVAFNLEVELPTDWVFPTPTPHTLSLFHAGEDYVNAKNETIGSSCLWELFAEVNQGASLTEDLFKTALSLKNVAFTKLSQAMFLINPYKYMPFDTQMNSLPGENLTDLRKTVQRINENGLSVYYTAMEDLRKAFPGCEFYEINHFNVLINSTEDDYLKLSNKYCQVSSYALGQEDKDYFDDFVKTNSIWVGAEQSAKGGVIYPLTEFSRGDLVLVRRGVKNLGGIGVVLENGYLPKGFDPETSIKILWLTREPRKIDGTGLGQWNGFDKATDNTIAKFREVYPETFRLIDGIRVKQRTMVNHSDVQFKNLILQGPPGTGKTRLAKQIALWLIDDTEKEISLIKAIDKRAFAESGQPVIEGQAQIKLVQFHPSYTYEDFVRGIKADMVGDPGKESVSYQVKDGILADLAFEASKPENQQKPYVLIIDEINRANLTSVLGELIYALEYRGKTVTSTYKKGDSHDFKLPHNLYIIGTMNTADRSVAHIDYAIRRRFTFIPVPPTADAITNDAAKNLYKRVQEIFDSHTSPEFDQKDIQIGHSYFLGSQDELPMRLKYEIKPLLTEYLKDGVLLSAAKDEIESLSV